ncbi:hypothetical protein MHB48_03395 [Psychrobacillus sp. FSL H8-0483]|uniref:hypothetical protein n=1 Tax=Psychrobacillus sp. FSL H8-0483 TaxID=2921389 RepID=UPI00315A89E9
MWKKAVPAVALCSLLLVGCNTNDDTVPSNNETPMQDIKRDVEDGLTPNVNTPSPDRDVNNNNNGVNDGTINNGVNGNGTHQNLQEQPITPNAENKWIKEPSVNDNDGVINDGTMK